METVADDYYWHASNWLSVSGYQPRYYAFPRFESPFKDEAVRPHLVGSFIR
jgi:hypothetical protein